MLNAVERVSRRALAVADRWMNRIYGSRWNPLYASGSIVVGLLVVLLVTGLYLLLFYRIGDPYGSVERITDQWFGEWIRTLHRYASDVAVVAIAVHAFRMFAQGRSWGPRALAWVSGLVLAFVFFVSGWTGYVMVWDWQGWMLAAEGARWLDVLPLFSEPISRLFVGAEPLPAAFFFLNLFLHIALPIGLGLILWVHVSRVARPTLLPPRGLRYGLLAGLVAVSVIWPIAMAGEADPMRLPGPGDVELDLFYTFWLPLTRALPAWSVWLIGGALFAASVSVIWLARPEADVAPPPSWVNERLCTGCSTCYEDCPYEAIAMVPRGLDSGDEAGSGDGSRSRSPARSKLVARVDPALCVSCGICAGSCAPMGIGPEGRTGRDQLAEVKAFVKEHGIGRNGDDGSGDDRRASTGGAAAGNPAGPIVVVGCDRSAVGPAEDVDGAVVYPVTCAGNLHTSVVEYLVRSGFGGVFIVACPERDCWSREGPKWLEQRLYHDREAELKERVDRRRVRVVNRAAGEARELADQLAAFRADIDRLDRTDAEEAIDLVAACETEEGVAVSVLEEVT